MEHSPDRVIDDSNSITDGEPLTKAKLFIGLDEGSEWSEVGIGIVSVNIQLVVGDSTNPLRDSSSGSRAHGGKVGKADTTGTSQKGDYSIALLTMVSIEDPSNVLITTPITLEDIYTVQEPSILVWSDPNLARELACSFNSRAGCNKIMDEIKAYQHGERQRLASTLQDEHIVPCKWDVQPAYLEDIFDAACKNTKLFGIYVRSHDTYIKQLVELFKLSQKSQDTKSMEYIGQIVLALLKTPYNSEGKIIGQFVDNDVIEDCIDIVQYAIGRRDKATGFISFEERRATFKNPCHLPENILYRVHIIFATSYLKDLVPLSLDEGDAMSSSLLNTFLLSYKCTLMEEVCRSPDLLPRAFQEAVAIGTSESLYSLADFVFDTSKTIKNSMIPLDNKEELYTLFVQDGFFTFANALLNHAIKSFELYDPDPVATTAHVPKDNGEVAAAETAIQATCETINHCVQILGSSRENLLTESATNPQRSTLSLLMKSITVVRKVATLQAVYDAILGSAVGLRSLLIPVTPAERAQRSDVVRFWVEGSGVEKPPLFLVASSLAQLLSHWTTTITPRSLPKQEETRALYHLRVLQVVAEEMEGRHGGSFTELLVLSRLIPALAALLGRSSRWCMNLQSSAVSFIAALLNTGCVRLLHLLTGKDGLIESCMRLFLECAQRNNVLSASLGRMLFDLCTLVHLGKRQSTELVAQRPSFTVALLEDSVNSRIGSSAPDINPSRQPNDYKNVHLYQETALTLLRTYGDQLAVKSPFIAEKLRHVLEETPEEAQQADTETSSIASTIERMPATSLSEYDALAVDFGLEILPSQRSRSHSPKNSSTGDPPYKLLFELHGEDSLSEFSLDDDRANNDFGNISRDKCDLLQENEESGEYAGSTFSEESEKAEGTDTGQGHVPKTHTRNNKDSLMDDEECMENEEESLRSKRHRSEESISSSMKY